MTLVQARPAHTIYRMKVLPVAAEPVKSTGLLVLKPAKNNDKLGAGGPVFRKGVFLGMPMYSLTLEERATCPLTCANWNRCYGNNMPFANRYKPGRPLERVLAKDVRVLSKRHPQGFVVRLHVLGDFYSVKYVEYWGTLLIRHQELRAFGYTHWEYGTPIGNAVTALVQEFAPRVSILRSDATDPTDPLPKAITVAKTAIAAPGTVLCPEQTGRTASCLDCGLCMNGRTSVSFIDHSR